VAAGNGGSGGGGNFTRGGAGTGIAGQGFGGSVGRSSNVWGAGGGAGGAASLNTGGTGVQWGSIMLGSSSFYAGGGSTDGSTVLGQNNYGGGAGTTGTGTQLTPKNGVIVITYPIGAASTTTTTSTTTTLAPTTTTTTMLFPDNCNCIDYFIGTTPGTTPSFSYYPCGNNGRKINVNLPYPQGASVCAISGSLVLSGSNIGIQSETACYTSSCPSTTTTSTTTTSTTTTAAPITTTTTYAPLGTLPSGAVVIYDIANASSWPGTGNFVYDLSGNGLTGTLYGTVSGSVNGLSFQSTNARLENTSSVFNSAMTGRKALFAAVQYQTGSINGNTGFINTWGGNPDLGYNFFINAGADGGRSSVRTGLQLYNSDGNAPQGFYLDPASFTIATGSAAHTYGIMANINSGSAAIYNNNVLLGSLTGINTSKFFVYNGTNATGNGFKIGNFVGTGQNFRGNIKKAIIYNRPLSDSELNAIEAWMTGSV
jgi:hypothetical protein